MTRIIEIPVILDGQHIARLPVTLDEWAMLLNAVNFINISEGALERYNEIVIEGFERLVNEGRLVINP